METVYLLLGSNLGDSLNHLADARAGISRLGQIRLTSSLYITEPWGRTDQPHFLNQAIALTTHLEPQALLASIHAIELKLGRNRVEKWGARTIDIDIIFYGNQIIETGNLVVPHPKMQARRFVLTPLSEISPTWIHPVLKKSIGELLAECNDPLEVRLYGSSD